MFRQLLWVCMQSESIFRGTLCRHSSQGIKLLQARFLDMAIKKVFFSFFGGVNMSWGDRTVKSIVRVGSQRSLKNKEGGCCVLKGGYFSCSFCTCCWEAGRWLKLMTKDSLASQCADAGRSCDFTRGSEVVDTQNCLWNCTIPAVQVEPQCVCWLPWTVLEKRICEDHGAGHPELSLGTCVFGTRGFCGNNSAVRAL